MYIVLLFLLNNKKHANTILIAELNVRATAVKYVRVIQEHGYDNAENNHCQIIKWLK